MHIQVNQISKSIQGKPILKDISLYLESGQSLALIGPNGSGKSTLLRIIAGLLKADYGKVMINNDQVTTLSPRMLAQRLGFVSQDASTTDAITVYDTVKLGRTPWLSFASPFKQQDERIVETAMREMAIDAYKSKQFNTLSDGEKQRVHIARVLAQTPQAFLLDEPTNHLDVRHQIAIIDWVTQQDSTVIMALHDLNHAFACDLVAVLDEGRLAAFGCPNQILVPEVIEPVFKITVHQTHVEQLNHPVLTFAKSSDMP